MRRPQRGRTMGLGPAGLTWQLEQQQQQQRPRQRPAAERRHSAGRGWHAPPADPHTGQRARGGDWGRTERPRRVRPGPTLCISSPLAFGEKRGEGQGRPEEGGRALDGAGRRAGVAADNAAGPVGSAREGPRAPAPSGPSTALQARPLRAAPGPDGSSADPQPGGRCRLWYWAGGLSLPAAAGAAGHAFPRLAGLPRTPHGSPAC